MANEVMANLGLLNWRRFTVDEYYRMAEAGILHHEERLELIEGLILRIDRASPRHAGHVMLTHARLHGQIRRAIIYSIHNPVRLSEYTEPEPDIALLQWRDNYYSDAHPGLADVLLLIEVADTSVDYDRNVKVPLYARAGIPEVWVINLAAETVEVYTAPGDSTYQRVQTRQKGDTLTPTTLPDVTLSVDELFV